MHIKEYPQVIKAGKVIAQKTCSFDIIDSFTEQMNKRGIVTFSYFFDREKINPDANNSEEIEMMDKADLPAGISYSEGFTPEDMLSALLSYMDTSMDVTSKLAFATQLHNTILGEIIENRRLSDEEL